MCPDVNVHSDVDVTRIFSYTPLFVVLNVYEVFILFLVRWNQNKSYKHYYRTLHSSLILIRGYRCIQVSYATKLLCNVDGLGVERPIVSEPFVRIRVTFRIRKRAEGMKTT